MVQLDVASLTAVTHLFAQDMRRRGRGKILLVASLLAYQGVKNFAVYSAAKAYVLRLGEALHRELKPDGVTATVLCPGMSNTGFATAAKQKITPVLKLLMMQPAPVVRAGIRALQAGRISVVPGWAYKAAVIFMWAKRHALATPGSSLSHNERMSLEPMVDVRAGATGRDGRVGRIHIATCAAFQAELVNVLCSANLRAE